MKEDGILKWFICGDVTPPKRNHGLDGGYDLYAPNLTERFIKDLTELNPGQPFRWGLVGAPTSEEEMKNNKGVYIYVPAHEDIIIPTYVKARIPQNMILRISNKSGVCSTQKFLVGAEIVDASYEGIIHIHLFNASNSNRFIEFGQKLVQAVPILIDQNEAETYYDNTIEDFKEFKNFVSVEDFYRDHPTQRGDGAFGSTGLK